MVLPNPDIASAGTQKGGSSRILRGGDDDDIGKVTFGMDGVAGSLVIVAATKVKGTRISREAHSSKMIGETPMDLFDEV